VRVLLVEEDDQLVALMTKALTHVGFEVDSASNVGEAKASLDMIQYAAVILEPNLADTDGFAVLIHMRRQHKQTPVIVLSARGSLINRIDGLRKGASDYLVKPFAMDELIARLHALLRRLPEPQRKLLTLGNVSLEIISRLVIVAGKPLSLNGRELEVFELLLKRNGQTVPSEVLQAHVFGNQAVSSNAIEVYVHRLRRILAEAAANVHVHNFRGVGYMMDLGKDR
jgi:two-component system, OmpR family, response regulator